MGIDRNLNQFIGGGHWAVNKSLVTAMGFEEAFWNTYLYEVMLKEINYNKIKEGDSFPISQEKIYDKIKISKEKQTAFIQNGVKRGYIEIERKGLPCRIFYKLNPTKLMEFIFDVAKEEGPESPKSPEKASSGKSQSLVADTDPSYPFQQEPVTANPATISTYKEPFYKNLLTSSKEEGDAHASPPANDIILPKIKINRETKPILSTLLSKEQFLLLPGYTKEAKELFLFWNSLTDPIQHHTLDTKTKVFKNSLEALDRKLNKGFGLDQIKKSMTQYQRLLVMETLRVSSTYKGINVSLKDFLDNPSYYKESLKKHKIDIKSWFDECLLPWSELEDKYSLAYKDKYPEITKELVATWPGERRNFTVKEMNIFRKVAERTYNYFVGLKDFKDDTFANHTRPATCVHFIWRMLKEKSHCDFGLVPGWTQGERFFQELDLFLREITWIVPGHDAHSRRVEQEWENKAQYARMKQAQIEEEAMRTAFSPSDFL